MGTGNMIYNLIHIHPGEDVKRQLLTFARGRQVTVILTGHGAVSAANIRVRNSAAPITYQGNYYIVSLSGSFNYNVVANGPHDPVGNLSILLSGPDGVCYGGEVQGDLTASGLVQVCVASTAPAAPEIEEDSGDSSSSSNPEDRESGNHAQMAIA